MHCHYNTLGQMSLNTGSINTTGLTTLRMLQNSTDKASSSPKKLPENYNTNQVADPTPNWHIPLQVEEGGKEEIHTEQI